MITRRGWRATLRPALCTLLVLAAAVPLLVTDGGPLAQAVADAAAAPPTEVAPVPDDAPIPAPEPPPVQRGLAQAAVNAAQEQASSSTELGVAVFDRSTGELVVGERGHERFYTASLSKLIVIVDVLDRRRTEGLQVTDDDLKLVARALGPSDDSANECRCGRSSSGAGRPPGASVELGLEGTTAPRRFGQWGEVEVTPADYATLWKYVLDDMPDDDRDLLISDMKAAPSTAKDGFDQAFGLLASVIRRDGSGAVAKQGWMCCFSGQDYRAHGGRRATRRSASSSADVRHRDMIGWPRRARDRPGSRRR